MAAKRLTRKEIVQQDSIRKTLTETSHWAVEHSRTIAIGLVAVVLIFLISFVWQHVSQSRDEKVQTAFSDALAMYHAPLATPESEQDAEAANARLQPKYKFASAQERYEKALAAFDQVAKDYSGSRVGDLAGYYSGLSLIELGRSDEAQSRLESLLSQSSYVDVQNQARNSLAQLAVTKGDAAQASDYLTSILDHPSENYPRQIVLMQLAQALESAGDAAGALERFRQVSSEFVGTDAATQAQDGIKRLEAKLGPSTAAAPAPPAAEPQAEAAPTAPASAQ